MIIAKYKFDKSIYENLLPVFNDGYAGYTISDEIDSENSNHVIRTIECDNLPTRFRFGFTSDNLSLSLNEAKSLIEVLFIDISNSNNLGHIFCNCQNLKLVNTSNWNTNHVTNMGSMFKNCQSLASLDVSNFNTSNVTNMGYMFWNCQSLTSLDVSNFNTSNVTDMICMFEECYNLTSLDVSKWDTSKVSNMYSMFNNCRSLTSLDVSNWNTRNVTSMYSMFYRCYNLTSLDVSNFNTSNVTDMSYMFNGCNNLTSLDVIKWNTSKVTNMYDMFSECQSLTSLDVSKWNTGNVTNMAGMFCDCRSLTSLDVSNWDTSKVREIAWLFCNCFKLTELNLCNFSTTNVYVSERVFSNCNNLTLIDISNWNTSNATNMGYLINNTSVSDIGMIYCDFKTVEKVASAIPTTNSTSIWVGNHIDINGLPQYDHITYKVYEVEDKLEVELSSPLLEGDRLEIIDGDLYHYHKMNITTLNGLETWIDNSNEDLIETKTFSCVKPSDAMDKTDHHKGKELSNLFKDRASMNDSEHFYIGMSYINIYINRSRLATLDPNGFKTWLQANPITIVYELANPYYELVKPNVGLLNAEQGLYLNISDSVVPVVNHQDLCTLKLNYLLSNVQYKVKFKANNAGSIAINLGGALVPLDVVEGWNEVMVTTPETLVDEYLKVNGSEDIKIQNVMVIDSNKDFDYFKGMNNTFDEIPVKNICKNRTLTYTHGVDEEGVSPQGVMNVNVNKGKVVTVVGKVSNNPNNLPISINLYNDTGRATGKNLFNGEFVTGMIQTSNGILSVESTDWISSKDFIKVNPNTDYISSGDVVNCMFMYDNNYKFIGCTNETYTDHGLRVKTTNNCQYIKIRCYIGDQFGSVVGYQYNNIQIEEAAATAYEPFRNYVNDNPVFIGTTSSVALTDEAIVDVSTTDGEYFAITIRADRDYANRIGFNVGDASSCEANDQVTITDLMVFEGDILDCHPTTYVDPADTRYLVEYKSIGNPFGFGKNKLI